MKPKLIFFFAIIIMAITIVLLLGLHISADREIVQMFQERQIFSAKQLSKQLETSLRDEARIVEILSSFSSLQNKNNEGIAEEIQKYYEYLRKEHVKSISVFDKNGSSIYSTLPHGVSINLTDKKLLTWAAQKANSGEQYITSVVPFTTSESVANTEFLVTIAAPIYQRASGEFIGVAAVVINYDEILSSFFNEASFINSKENAWLVDKEGTVLYHPEHPEMMGINISDENSSCLSCHTSFTHVETILNTASGSIKYRLKDRPQKLASFVTLNYKNISWKIVVNAPLDEVTTVSSRLN